MKPLIGVKTLPRNAITTIIPEAMPGALGPRKARQTARP